MVRLERTVGRNIDVFRLLLRQPGQLGAKAFEMQAGYFLIQVFRQHLDTVCVVFAVFPNVDLSEYLVSKAGRHDETGMPGGIAQVKQPSLRQQYHSLSRRHFNHVHVVLDIGPFVVPQSIDLNFIVKMADVSDDCHILEFSDMLDSDHISVAGSRNHDIRA